MKKTYLKTENGTDITVKADADMEKTSIIIHAESGKIIMDDVWGWHRGGVKGTGYVNGRRTDLNILISEKEWKNSKVKKEKLINTETYCDVHEFGESAVSVETWRMDDGTTKEYRTSRSV